VHPDLLVLGILPYFPTLTSGLNLGNYYSPWENGYIESFNGKLRDELLKREVFDTLYEAQVLIERWRIEYNTIRPHSSLGYRPPVPETMQSRWHNLTKFSHKYWYN